VWRHNRLPHDGWTYIKLAAEHCPYGPNRRDALMQWFELVCAPIPTRRQADDILDRVPPRRWSADALGRHLRVTDAERATLRIYTIGSYQTPKAEREKRRKEKRRLAAQARRRANGSKPREQSFSRTKPWEAFGIKRRAWERRGKPAPVTTQIRNHDSYRNHGHVFASCDSARCSRRKPTGRLSPKNDVAVAPHEERGHPTTNCRHAVVRLRSTVMRRDNVIWIVARAPVTA
jgi:hypothetical protein